MTFISLEYLLFLPAIVLLYFLLAHKYRWVLLLIASYLFYGYWNASLLILIVISTLVDYWAGLKMGGRLNKVDKKVFLYVSLFVNLGMLFFFKYFSFCNEAVREFFQFFDYSYSVKQFDILLPVGISFYTFQTLSYTIDVYRGHKKPEKHLGIFALYVSFFPQLVAGPIEKSTYFIPQFYKKYQFNIQRIVSGCKLILWGLFKKMIIADNLALIVNEVYGNSAIQSSEKLIIATYAFTIQVYCDFSGYTDIAIGSARIFGFELSDNFRKPFFASNISEFWRRWHISLTQWIGDYIYRPLLGKYKSNTASYFILYIVLIAIGVWHGAGGQFVLFGFIHATYIAVRRLLKPTRISFNNLSESLKLEKVQKFLGIIWTFHLVAFSLICFASKSISESFQVMKSVFTFSCSSEITSFISFQFSNFLIVACCLPVVFLIELTNKKSLREPFEHISNIALRWGIYLFIVFSLLIFKESNNPTFYYFQF